MDETHDPARHSWVESANVPGTGFPIQNLPLGVFRRGGTGAGRIGVAIGEEILDLAACQEEGFLSAGADAARDPVLEHAGRACAAGTLNELMALGRAHWRALRGRLGALLDSGAGTSLREKLGRLLVSERDVQMLVPATIGDYTDFYASVFHATNVGRLFRPDNPLLPNYKHVPIAYHGRASSVVTSGTPVRRPTGQMLPAGRHTPSFGPSTRLDYELEVGFFVGPGNGLGEPIDMADAESHIFGICIVNDWSARDIQSWEYQPLGPFLAKSFATTISPWVVTLDALEPYRVAAFNRPDMDPQPLPYLDCRANRERGGLDLELEVRLGTGTSRATSAQPPRLSRVSFASVYWTLAQMLTHHASNGCNLRPGDLIASGTVSGADRGTEGCLLEITHGGREPVSLPGGESRSFLQDGDEVIISGWCERPGFVRIGLGECRGTVTPAVVRSAEPGTPNT
jgi:fumarylacetoacetase